MLQHDNVTSELIEQLIRFLAVKESINGADAGAFAAAVVFYFVFAVEIFNRGATVV